MKGTPLAGVGPAEATVVEGGIKKGGDDAGRELRMPKTARSELTVFA